eukprot:697336-Amphidinium_carterae.1
MPPVSRPWYQSKAITSLSYARFTLDASLLSACNMTTRNTSNGSSVQRGHPADSEKSARQAPSIVPPGLVAPGGKAGQASARVIEIQDACILTEDESHLSVLLLTVAVQAISFQSQVRSPQ